DLVPHREEEAFPDQLSGEFRFATVAMDDPGLRGPCLASHPDQLFPRFHTVDDHRFAQSLRQLDVFLEDRYLYLEGRSFQTIQTGLADGDDTGVGSNFIQIGHLCVTILRVPGMDAA